MRGEDCALYLRAAVFRFVRLLSFFLGQPSPDPDLAADCAERFHDYRVLANGLAAVLARCPADLVRRDLQASAEALRLLRRQFKSAFGEPSLPAALLNDLAHEVAHRADAPTRSAALRCLQRSVEARRLQAAARETSPAR